MMMPCITLWEPWASLVALGLKKIETRTHARFATLKHQRIAIHAGLKWDMDALELASPFLQKPQVEQILHLYDNHEGGAVVCTAFVHDARWLEPVDAWAALVDCTNTRRFGLVLADVIPVSSERITGRQGVFRIDSLQLVRA